MSVQASTSELVALSTIPFVVVLASGTCVTKLSTFPLALSTGILFSSLAPAEVFLRASLLTTSLAPVLHTDCAVALSPAVAISAVPFTVSLIFGVAVPVSILAQEPQIYI